MNTKRQKDQEMAQRLKAQGDERTTGRCCMCYQMIAVGYPQSENATGFLNHIISCPGPRKRISYRPRREGRRAA